MTRILILFFLPLSGCFAQCVLVMNPLSGQLNCGGGGAAQFSDDGTTLSTTKNLAIGATVLTDGQQIDVKCTGMSQ